MTPEKCDIICPIHYLDLDSFKLFIQTWAQNIPIRRLIIGLGNENVELKKFLFQYCVSEPFSFELIEQFDHKTLGYCLQELINQVETEYFIFLHADVEIPQNWFEKMWASRVKGIVESLKAPSFGPDSFIQASKKRAYSGAQLILKESVENLNFGDDFVYCYDKETEILTKEGWKYFENLNDNDLVATLDKKHNMFYEKPKELYKLPYIGDMIKINHRSVDLLITPNHRLYIRRRGKDYNLIKAENMNFQYFHTLNHINWKGKERKYFKLPSIKQKSNMKQIHKILMDDWLEFLGWFISEGCTTKTGYNYRIVITQRKEENRKEIIDCIKKIGFKPTPDKDQIYIHSKQLYIYLKKLGKSYQKYIPPQFLNLSIRQLKILFDTLIKGDGTNCNDCIIYYTTSKKLADQVQELIIKLGFNSTLHKPKLTNGCVDGRIIYSKHQQYHIRLRKAHECHFLTRQKDPKRFLPENKFFSKIHYNDFVYCCSVENDIVCVRRNGRVTWCGNTNEDIIIQNIVLNRGFSYVKMAIFHHHHRKYRKRTQPRKTILEWQWKGIVKYAYPTSNLMNYIKGILRLLSQDYEIKADLETEIKALNPKWLSLL